MVYFHGCCCCCFNSLCYYHVVWRSSRFISIIRWCWCSSLLCIFLFDDGMIRCVRVSLARIIWDEFICWKYFVHCRYATGEGFDGRWWSHSCFNRRKCRSWCYINSISNLSKSNTPGIQKKIEGLLVKIIYRLRTIQFSAKFNVDSTTKNNQIFYINIIPHMLLWSKLDILAIKFS